MSLPNPSDLANIPGLSPWLTHERWRNEFDEDELVEGEGLPVASIRITGDDEPMPGMVTVDAVAKAALFLVSDDASFITAVALPIDGGYTAR